MDNTTTTGRGELFGTGCVFEVGSLSAALARVPDHRKRRGVRYPLVAALTIIALAKLAGEDEPTGIAAWACWRAEWLVAALGLKRPELPHRTTYGRIVAKAVRVEEVEAVLGEFLAHQPSAETAVVISLDGKTLRGTIPVGQSQGVHLLVAYLPEAGVVLLQVQVERKENEIPVALKVLQGMELNGKIIRGDALLTQRGLSAHIVAAGGDYVWLAKDNQPQLRDDIAQAFAPAVCAPGFSPGPTDFQQATTVNKGHGRTDGTPPGGGIPPGGKRTLTTTSSLKGYLDWPGVEQVFQLEREVQLHRTGETRHEVVYGLTSLTATEAGPQRLLHLTRLHWEVENGLFYRRDVTFHEDACGLRLGHAQQVLAVFNNLVLGMLLSRGVSNVPEARRRFNARPHEALALITGTPT